MSPMPPRRERLGRTELIHNVIHGTKEVSPSGSKETHNFNFLRSSTSKKMKRTVVLSLEKAVSSVDHDRTVAS